MPFLVIKVPKFSTQALERRLVKTMDRRGRRNENILLRTTQYFETVKPVFVSRFEKMETEWRVITGPKDDESGRIWTFLDQGTSVRYAWMDEDYVAGTTPGTLATTPTAGQKISVTPQFPAAEEGIEARLWTEVLTSEQIDPYTSEMQKAVKSWLKDFGSAASRIISGE